MAMLFFKSDTSGEKDFEEFYTDNEKLDLLKFQNIGIIKNKLDYDQDKLNHFNTVVNELAQKEYLNKDEIVRLFNEMITNFNHKETGKYLDRM